MMFKRLSEKLSGVGLQAVSTVAVAAGSAAPVPANAATFTEMLCKVWTSISGVNEKLAFVVGVMAFLVFFLLFTIDDRSSGGIARVIQIIAGIAGVLTAPSILGWFGISGC